MSLLSLFINLRRPFPLKCLTDLKLFNSMETNVYQIYTKNVCKLHSKLTNKPSCDALNSSKNSKIASKDWFRSKYSTRKKWPHRECVVLLMIQWGMQPNWC